MNIKAYGSKAIDPANVSKLNISLVALPGFSTYTAPKERVVTNIVITPRDVTFMKLSLLVQKSPEV